MPFSNPLCSLSSNCCYCLELPSLSVHVISLLSFPFTHTHHFHSKVVNKIAVPYVCYSPHHFLISRPFIPFCLTTYSLDVFYSLPSNHTNQLACTQHIICCTFAPNLLLIYCRPISLIQFICHFIDFANVASKINPPFRLSFAPHFLIFTLLILCY